jgi:hypothetical protein
MAISSSSSSRRSMNGFTAEQGQQRSNSSSRGLATQGACWLLLGVAVTAWQLVHI